MNRVFKAQAYALYGEISHIRRRMESVHHDFAAFLLKAQHYFQNKYGVNDFRAEYAKRTLFVYRYQLDNEVFDCNVIWEKGGWEDYAVPLEYDSFIFVLDEWKWLFHTELEPNSHRGKTEKSDYVACLRKRMLHEGLDIFVG